MVILQFNKLIRNKWVWGAFAVTICAAFCFQDFSAGPSESSGDGAGTLNGETVSMKAITPFMRDARGYARRLDNRTTAEINLDGWKAYAANLVAQENGLKVSDEEIASILKYQFMRYMPNGFDYKTYLSIVRGQLGLSGEEYEAVLRRQHTAERAAGLFVELSSWISPMELDRRVYDENDEFAIKAVYFNAGAADKVTLDEKALHAWYDENKDDLVVPESVKIRYIEFSAENKAVLEKMVVSEDSINEEYEIGDYTVTDTNGVKTLKPLADVKPQIIAKLKKEAAIEFYVTNLIGRAFAQTDDKTDVLERIAKEDNLKVKESAYFSIDFKPENMARIRDRVSEGFLRNASSILPGARDFAATIADMDTYEVIEGTKNVWLVAKVDTKAEYTPSWEEAQKHIRRRAEREASEKAFENRVSQLIKKGSAEVVKQGNFQTNHTFSISRDVGEKFADFAAITEQAKKLKTGEVSNFISLNPSKAVVVICDKRTDGLSLVNGEMRAEKRLEMSALRPGISKFFSSWLDWNLERMELKASEGFTTTEESDDDEA
jgi:hypothetical protein